MKHRNVIQGSLTYLCCVFPLICHTTADRQNIASDFVQLAQAYEQLDQKEKALTYYLKATECNSSCIHTRLKAANIIRDLDRFDEAVACYKNILKDKPNHLQALMELGSTLSLMGKNPEALTCYLKAVKLDPNNPSCIHNFAFILKQNSRYTHAIEVFETLIKRVPNYALAHFNLALTYLMTGNYERGLQEYEWRWQAHNEESKTYACSAWDGTQDLHDKTVIVYAEQGLGDTLQFVRFIPLLKQRGAHIILAAQAELVPLLRLCPYIDQLIELNDIPKVHVDYYAPLMSLPLLLKTTLDTIPHDVPYLYADQQLVEQWKKTLGDTNKIKVGICWQGNSKCISSLQKQTVSAKAVPCSLLAKLGEIPGVQLYSLQYQDEIKHLASVAPYTNIHQFDNTFDVSHGRFMDTAAIIKNMDLVITVDTSIAHLAGALGAPTCVLLPMHADWRWLINRTDSPWYPTVRLFRQHTAGHWDDIVDQLYEALQEMTLATTKSPDTVPDKEALKNKLNLAFYRSSHLTPVSTATKPELQPLVQSYSKHLAANALSSRGESDKRLSFLLPLLVTHIIENEVAKNSTCYEKVQL